MSANEPSSDRAVRFLAGAQEQLAAFARASYATDGRGVVRVRIPEVGAGVLAAVVSTEMVYHTCSQVRELTASLQGDSGEDAAALLRMIDTYDPERQAVVVVAFATGNPVSVKMKLERPFVIDEARGVH